MTGGRGVLSPIGVPFLSQARPMDIKQNVCATKCDQTNNFRYGQKYTSHEMHNEMLKVMALQILRDVAANIRQLNFFQHHGR